MFAAPPLSLMFPALARSRHGLPAALRRRLIGLLAWAAPRRYRPEQHYMRGGRTTGARSQNDTRGGTATRR